MGRSLPGLETISVSVVPTKIDDLSGSTNGATILAFSSDAAAANGAIVEVSWPCRS